ncbi:hypothetical protein pEaSNUABM37_00172 [Erwinia phage pEa_SNUABM_37]|nr:hypothetical protein pEaSNUABM37_00172 [Erwinia phage pEa_SNUABM_37]QXO10642.1 hypothetical protein pEaSNUABM48_00172 [Erwinia phage pEa_SNUABM_48]
MSTNLYDNANVLANVVSTTAAVMEAISGNDIADLSDVKDQNVIANLAAAKLQNILTPLLISGAGSN